jgi:hypothetical protein
MPKRNAKMQSKNTFQKHNKKPNVKIPFKAKMPFRSAIQYENAALKCTAKTQSEIARVNIP